jgi:hypothetical protein
MNMDIPTSYILIQNLKRKYNILDEDSPDQATAIIHFMRSNPDVMLDLMPSTEGGLIMDNIDQIEMRLQIKHPVMARRLQ